MFETEITDNKIIIPPEILKMIGKSQNIIQWEINDDGRINLKFKEMPTECEELIERVEKTKMEIKQGHYIKGDAETLAKRYRL